MIAAATENLETDAADAMRALAEEQMRVLAEVNRIQLRMLQAMERHALEPAPEQGPDRPELREEARPEAAALSLGMTRLAKSIRQNLSLQTRIADQTLAQRLAAEAERAARAAERKERIKVRRADVDFAMTQAIDNGSRPIAEIDRFSDDVDDWMDGAEDDIFDTQPIGVILQRLCRDIGLPLDLTVWENEAWAMDEMVHRPPGSPYTTQRRTPGRVAKVRGARVPEPPA